MWLLISLVLYYVDIFSLENSMDMRQSSYAFSASSSLALKEAYLIQV